MKKHFLIIGLILVLASAAFSQFSFYLIDNFESGNFDRLKWWRFGDLKVKVTENASPEGRDLIAESCGQYALNFSGDSKNWYVGGVGTEMGMDATRFSRFQIDVFGSDEYRGKLIIELLEDDNGNYSIEQDPKKNYDPLYDDKWVAELNIQGKGFTRVSIPFSAFRDANPGVGDDKWNPEQKNGSGGLLKLQLVAITDKKEGKIDFSLDNLLLTF